MPAMRTSPLRRLHILSRDFHARIGGQDGTRHRFETIRRQTGRQLWNGIGKQLRIKFHADDAGRSRQHVLRLRLQALSPRLCRRRAAT